MNKEMQDLLIKKATEARARSYAPYSDFAVGAALLCADGSIYTGANIENASFTPTVCAERVAFFKAISEGEREFVKIAVCGGPMDRQVEVSFAPCGVCRQVMREFCTGDFEVLLVGKDITKYTLDELFPASFGKENME